MITTPRVSGKPQAGQMQLVNVAAHTQRMTGEWTRDEIDPMPLSLDGPDDTPDEEGPDGGDREPRNPQPAPPSLEATADED